MSRYKGIYAKITKILPPRPGEYLDEISLDIDKGRHYWDIIMFSEILNNQIKNNVD